MSGARRATGLRRNLLRRSAAGFSTASAKIGARRPVEPVRPDERLDERWPPRLPLRVVLEDGRELRRVLLQRRGDVQEAAVLRAAGSGSGASLLRRTPAPATVRTLLPTIAASIIAVVLIPTTAAPWESESKKPALASSPTGREPPAAR